MEYSFKRGCPPKFTSFLKGFHDGMTACVTTGGLVSESFTVYVDVNQGCMLAHIISSICLLAMITVLSTFAMTLALPTVYGITIV